MITVALIFIVLGIGIKYAKMYYLIAGYNTMSKEQQARVDIEGIASLFLKIMVIMGTILILASLVIDYYKVPEIETYVIDITVPAGVLWLIIRSNSKKYRIDI
jgi:hypothetical protein